MGAVVNLEILVIKFRALLVLYRIINSVRREKKSNIYGSSDYPYGLPAV